VKVEFLSEMVRNAYESEFRTSKIATGWAAILKKKIKVEFLSEMARNANEIQNDLKCK
jgi:hypothetical protein